MKSIQKEKQDAICTEHGREGCFHKFPVQQEQTKSCHRKKNWVVYYRKGCKHHDPVITGISDGAVPMDFDSLELRITEIERRLNDNGIY